MKSFEVSIKTRSTTASLSTKHATVNGQFGFFSEKSDAK